MRCFNPNEKPSLLLISTSTLLVWVTYTRVSSGHGHSSSCTIIVGNCSSASVWSQLPTGSFRHTPAWSYTFNINTVVRPSFTR